MEVTAQIVSLLDPLSGERVVIPVKGPNCTHPNIWDKENWSLFGASINWKCIFCQKEAKMDTLKVDTTLQRIIERLSASVIEIKMENGQWVEDSTPVRKNILDISPKPVIRFREPQKAFDISGGQPREYKPNLGQASSSPISQQRQSGVIDISRSSSTTASTPRASVDLTPPRQNSPSTTASSGGFEILSRSPGTNRVHSQSLPQFSNITTSPPTVLATMPSAPREQIAAARFGTPPSESSADEHSSATRADPASPPPVECSCKSQNKKTPLPDCTNCGKTIKKGYHACPNKNLCSKCHRKHGIKYEEETTSGWREIDGKCSIQ